MNRLVGWTLIAMLIFAIGGQVTGLMRPSGNKPAEPTPINLEQAPQIIDLESLARQAAADWSTYRSLDCFCKLYYAERFAMRFRYDELNSDAMFMGKVFDCAGIRVECSMNGWSDAMPKIEGDREVIVYGKLRSVSAQEQGTIKLRFEECELVR